MTSPDPTPELRDLVGGKYAAVCVRCVRPSFPVPAASAAEAWQELRRHGWQDMPATDDAAGGPKCPQCAARVGADAAPPAWKPRHKR